MATSFTTNIHLQKPATADRQWDIPLNANADLIDSLAAVGGLAVTPTEQPSSSLNCQISGGAYQKADGTLLTFNGVPQLTLPPNATCFIWLDSSADAVTGTAYPSTPYLCLAQVQTAAMTVAHIIDQRIAYQEIVPSALFVAKTGDTISGLLQIVGPSGQTLLSLDPVHETLSFFGAQNTGQAQSITSLINTGSGVASNSVVDVGIAYSQQTLNNNFASIVFQLNTVSSFPHISV